MTFLIQNVPNFTYISVDEVAFKVILAYAFYMCAQVQRKQGKFDGQ